MCGLAALFGDFGPERVRRSLDDMLEVQLHRGPDSSGVWYDKIFCADVGLGFRRLKIIDLSDEANQPMLSEDERFVLVFNGEIYNYIELREELAASGVRFRTRGDTEVLLQALILWGPKVLARLNGMWAFVLLDRFNGEVLLSRDRFGIKPLYTYRDGSGFFVSSEIKAILRVAGRRFQVSGEAANAYLRQSLLSATTSTFFAGVEEFPAGRFCKVSVADIAKTRFETQPYWTIPTEPPTHLSGNAIIEAVRDTFIDSVRLRLRSDVPVGVLLSGGIDSSAISAAVNYLDPSRSDIRLLSAVGNDDEPDEQPFVDLMATHLKRPVEKVVLDYPPAKALELISEVSWFNDQPIGNLSTVAHYLLMKRARNLGVTVLLSGQGADEILCGYKKYLGFYLQELIARGRWLTSAGVLGKFLGRGTVVSQFSYQEAKRYLPKWLRLPEVDIRGPALLEGAQWLNVGLNGGGVVERQIADIEKLSVPALVHYEDRMSMAVAREIRLPFLDYRLVSLLAPLPVEWKLRDGWTKWIFRRAMESLLPKEIAWRKDKQPFPVPQNQWFRSYLRDQVSTLLAGEWVTERLELVDRSKFRASYDAYLRQPAGGGRISFKNILAPVALELWAKRFEPYLSF